MTNLNDLARQVHKANYKWWHDENDNKIERNKGEMICLMHSELSEAMEGERKDLMDDKLPHHRMAEVEMADVIIRILDYCAAYNYDLEGAFRAKMAFNATRKDHTYKERNSKHGKRW